MSDQLADLISREELKYVQQYVFENDDEARKVYSAMLGNYVPVPLKCAVALVRDITFGWSGVVLFIGSSFRIPEMPKPIDQRFSWDEYLEKLGLTRQDEWKQWSSNSFPGFARAFDGVVVVDYFLSTGLKGGGYRCLACDESFTTYDELFDLHIYNKASHDREFNAALLAQLVQVAVAEADTSAAALNAARKLVPPGAEILEERTSESNTKRGQANGNSSKSVERAFENARKYVPANSSIIEEKISTPGCSKEIEIKLALPVRNPKPYQIDQEIRRYVEYELPELKELSPHKFDVDDFVCIKPGSQGLLGIGRRSGEYRVQISAPWDVIIEYELIEPAKAQIRYRRPQTASS
jgi:hypothetical protein